MSTAHATAQSGHRLHLLNRAGRPMPSREERRRSCGRPPGNKGKKYDPEILDITEIQILLLAILEPSENDDWRRVLARERLHGLCVVLWRTGIRISEALDLRPGDLKPEEKTIVIRNGKGGKRRIVVMDNWGWKHLTPWLETRADITPGYLFPIICGPTEGQKWAPTDVRRKFREAAKRCNLQKRFHPHGLRHNFSVEFWLETGNLLALMTQLGHCNLGVTQIYLRALTVEQILAPVGLRDAPVVPLGKPASLPSRPTCDEKPARKTTTNKRPRR